MPRSLRFENQPPSLFKFDEKDPRVTKVVGSAGCKRTAKFIIPLLPDEVVARILPDDSQVAITTGVPDEFDYREIDFDDFDFDDDANPVALTTSGQPRAVSCCAVDDAMGMWPRFQSAMHTGESFMTD